MRYVKPSEGPDDAPCAAAEEPKDAPCAAAEEEVGAPAPMTTGGSSSSGGEKRGCATVRIVTYYVGIYYSSRTYVSEKVL